MLTTAGIVAIRCLDYWFIILFKVHEPKFRDTQTRSQFVLNNDQSRELDASPYSRKVVKKIMNEKAWAV